MCVRVKPHLSKHPSSVVDTTSSGLKSHPGGAGAAQPYPGGGGGNKPHPGGGDAAHPGGGDGNSPHPGGGDAEKFDVVVGADIIYSGEAHARLCETLPQLLRRPSGVAVLCR